MTKRKDAGTPLIEWKIDQTRFRDYVRAELGRYAQGNQAVERANYRSLRWLMQRAAENLADAMASHNGGRAPDPRHGRLRDLILNEGSHGYSADRIEFLIYEKMQAIDARVASYRRAIEFGTDYWVRRTKSRGIMLTFRGDPEYPTRGVPPIQAGFVGPRDGVPTRITRPVPKYLYATHAVDSFKKGRVYAKNILDELARVGIYPSRKRSKA